MSRKKVCPVIKKRVIKTIKNKDGTIQIFSYPDEVITVRYDKYNRCCGMDIKTISMSSHFPRVIYHREVHFYYDKMGYQIKKVERQREFKKLVYYMEIEYIYDSCNNLQKIQKKHYDENNKAYYDIIDYKNIYNLNGNLKSVLRVRTEGDICKAEISYMNEHRKVTVWHENGELKNDIIIYQNEIMEKIDFYLSRGELSYVLVKEKARDGIILCKKLNPMNGKYCWMLFSLDKESYINNNVVHPYMIFEIKIYEPIFTNEIFLEILHYAMEKTDVEITLLISGDFFCVPQIEADRIYQTSLRYNVSYHFNI